MDNFNLNEIYKSQPAGNPSMEELNKRLKQLKRSGIRKLYITIITFTLTSFFIIWVVAEYDSHMFSTKFGTALVLLAMVFYGLSYNRMLPLLKKADEGNSSTEFLQNLILLKKKQQRLQGSLLNLYFILLTVGLFLYMIEPTSRMSVRGQLISYGLTLAWIVFNWFYVRPRKIKKEQGKIDSLIERFGKMKEQMGEE